MAASTASPSPSPSPWSASAGWTERPEVLMDRCMHATSRRTRSNLVGGRSVGSGQYRVLEPWTSPTSASIWPKYALRILAMGRRRLSRGVSPAF